ncbi:hypothetical protein [Jutongia sp.]|uniref:hypothetical protein n=1 Tax=Jutongia sp. TaxID=2944204 RepID=UPI003079719C
MGETEQEQIKVLIVSDSHGRNDNLRKAVANMRGTHCRMLHAGDFQCSPQEIYDLAGVPVDKFAEIVTVVSAEFHYPELWKSADIGFC